MKVTMIAQISGTRNGAPWPQRGQTIDLPKDEADRLIANAQAVVGNETIEDAKLEAELAGIDIDNTAKVDAAVEQARISEQTHAEKEAEARLKQETEQKTDVGTDAATAEQRDADKVAAEQAAEAKAAADRAHASEKKDETAVVPGDGIEKTTVSSRRGNRS